MSKPFILFQYSCPSCDYTLYAESDDEELYCLKKTCSFKEPLHIRNRIESSIIENSRFYTVKDSFMVDHGCCEVRPIKAGTVVEVIKIKKGWGYCETEDGFSFHIPMERLKRKK